MTLIKLENGHNINPAHVVSYEKYHNGSAKFLMTAGEFILGKPVSEDFEEAFYPIIPAAAGFYAVYADAQEDLTRLWSRKAIVGWQIAPGGTYPVVQGDDTGKYPVGRMEPDGTCADFDGNHFDSLNALKSAIAEEDFEFLANTYPDKGNEAQSDLQESIAVHILNVHQFKIDAHQVLFFTCRALQTQAEFCFNIITESSDFEKQECGQNELAMLGWSAGLDPLTDEKHLIGETVIIHPRQSGGGRFDPLPVKKQAA